MSDIMMTDDTINLLGCKGANLVYTTHAKPNVKEHWMNCICPAVPSIAGTGSIWKTDKKV